MVQQVRIPRERIGALLGPKGKDKRSLQKKSGIVIEVQSSDGLVIIDPSSADPIMGMKVAEFVKAVGRGFSPQVARRLLEDDQYLRLIDIRDFAGKSQRRIIQVRGRVIGQAGRTRKVLEDLSGCLLAIQGTTIAIIGGLGEIEPCSEAIEMLLSGSEHAAVYGFLERNRRRDREKSFLEAAFGIGIPEGDVPTGGLRPPEDDESDGVGEE